MFLVISLENISKETTIDGWVRLHALAIWRLVILAETIEPHHQHWVIITIKEPKEKFELWFWNEV